MVMGIAGYIAAKWHYDDDDGICVVIVTIIINLLIHFVGVCVSESLNLVVVQNAMQCRVLFSLCAFVKQSERLVWDKIQKLC